MTQSNVAKINSEGKPHFALIKLGKFITFKEMLTNADGRPSGFDYIRLILSISVIIMHSAITSYGRNADIAVWQSPLRGLVVAILPMFFALSGFLVAGSWLRCKSLIKFLGLRVIRIYPALTVEVLLSAFLLGPFFTNLPLSEYFTNKDFYQYLINVTGHIHYTLPGVFTDNPFPNTVNAQLWTVPYELLCYISITALTFINGKTNRKIVLFIGILFTIAYPIARMIIHNGSIPIIIGGASGAILVQSYIWGIVTYLYSDKIFTSDNIIYILLVALISYIIFSTGIGLYISAPIAAYLTISLGLLNPKRVIFIKGADYSYGIYLYGFVIQQALVASFTFARIWWINSLISIILATAFAAISWHYVEKPALKLKNFLPKN